MWVTRHVRVAKKTYRYVTTILLFGVGDTRLLFSRANNWATIVQAISWIALITAPALNMILESRKIFKMRFENQIILGMNCAER